MMAIKNLEIKDKNYGVSTAITKLRSFKFCRYNF